MKKRIIKIISLFCAVLMLFSLISCQSGIPSENIISEDENAPQKEEEKKPDDGILHLISGGRSDFKITYSERADADTVKLAENLGYSILKKTGTELKIKSDYVSRVEDISEETPEILIGLTNRKSSIELNKKIDVLQYAIKITDTKVVIVGKSVEALSWGVDAFVSNYLETGALKAFVGEWAIRKNVEIISDKGASTVKNLMGEWLKLVARGIKIGELGGAVQGGCVVGGNYFSITDVGGSKIVKYDLKNKNTVQIGSTLYTGDLLDLEYDDKEKALALTDGTGTIKYLTADTLAESGTGEVGVKLKAAAYIGGGAYAAVDGDTGELVIFDSLLEETVREEITLTNVLSMTADSRFIYLLGELDGKTLIAAYNRSGELINTVTLELGEGQSLRSITEYNGKFIIGVNTQSGGEIYEFTVEVVK